VGSHWLNEMIFNVANAYLLYVIGLLVCFSALKRRRFDLQGLVGGKRRKVEGAKSFSSPINLGYVGVDPVLVDMAFVGPVHSPD
jgi:hypothetical protein